MARRYRYAAIALLVLLASCGSDESVTTTAPATSTPTTTTGPEDSQTTTSETTTSPGEQEPQPTSTTTDGTLGSLVLGADGLGIVDFGQPREEVTQILAALIGTPPTDRGSEAGWVEYIGWADVGLYLGFDTPTAETFTGVSRFVGWTYSPPNGLDLATSQGVGIGTTLSDARAAYGERLQVPAEPDECIGDWMYVLTSASGDVEIVGTLDRPPADDARIASAQAGIGVGC